MDFIKALEKNDTETIISIRKSDIHSHGGRGGNPSFISEKTGVKIPSPPQKFDSLSHMQEWFDHNIKPVCRGREGNILRWEACFAEAQRNNIVRLALSFSIGDIELVGGMEPFVAILNGFKEQYCPKTSFEPELAYSAYCNMKDEKERIADFLEYGFFRSIDINSGENVQLFKNFVPLYQKAEEYGMVKRMHVGEFGTADDVRNAVEVLGLDEVHHGIAAAASKSVMQLLADRKITLNICPSSNVMLKVAESYKEHPIKILVRNGVPVTINTDDLLIFNQSIDKEYSNLFHAGTLTAEELNDIRLRGIKEI
ncbi:MAG: adenosine deaminase [Lachnospiraceae bacterium]|nr:adenosine deaminase [Lachnospiraceae bacterium]